MGLLFDIPEMSLRLGATAEGITHFTSGVAIIRDGAVLIVRRAADDYMGGYYELPGGGIDANESFVDAVARETLEETGLTVTSVDRMFAGFDYKTPKKPHVRQLNFVVSVAAGEVELAPDEHDHFLWIRDESELQSLQITDHMMKCILDALVLAQN